MRLRIGGNDFIATVIEDRGHIGVDGRQIVRIEVEFDPEYITDFEASADDLRRVA